MTHSSLKSIGVTTSFHEVEGNKSFRFPPSTRLIASLPRVFQRLFGKQAAWINNACSVVKRWIIPISKKHINCGLILSALNHINGSSKRDGKSFSKFLEVHSGSETKYVWSNYISKINHLMEVWMIYFFSDQTSRLTKCEKYKHPNLFSGAIFAGNSNLQKWEHRHRNVASWCFASDRFTKHSTSNPAQSQLWFDTRVLDAPFWKQFLSKQGSHHVWSC